MKKKLFILLLTVTLIISFAFGASAAINDESCLVSEDLSTVTYDGKTYLLSEADTPYISGEYLELDVRFEVSSMSNRYKTFEVTAYEKCDYILEARIELYDGNWEALCYIEESRFDKIEALSKGEGAANYQSYGFDISVEDIEGWKSEGETMQISGAALKMYEAYPLLAEDADGIFRFEVGQILRIPSGDEGRPSMYYLLDYSDYDRSYFYADGSFAMDNNVMATVYLLTNEKFAAILDLEYDREIIVNDPLFPEASDAVIGVVCVFLFGILPLTVAVICLVFMIKKVRMPYQKVLSYLIFPASLLLIACMTVVLVLLS